MSQSIGKLIKQAQQGDAQAVSQLYHQHVDAMTRFVAFRVSHPNVVEDLIADIFLAMLEGLPTYEYRGIPFAAWLYRIAHAKVVDYYRQNQREQQIELQDEIASQEPILEWNIERGEEFAALQEAIQHLNEAQQTILILRFVEQKTHEEVAEILDKSPAAIMTAQHRALNELAQLMGTDKRARSYLRGVTDNDE